MSRGITDSLIMQGQRGFDGKVLEKRLASLRITAHLRSIVSVLAVCALLAAVAFLRQPEWPAPWQDEGFTIQGAMNLSQHGTYAMRSSEGFRVLDQPLVANGPGVVLPMSWAFNLLGVGFWQARLVAGSFLVVAGLAYFLLARTMAGSLAAWISLLLLIALPSTGLVTLGRAAIGSVPGLAYFLLGGLAWIRVVDRGDLRAAVLAGVLFGMAAVTKGQYSLVFFPALLFAWLIGRVLRHRVDTRATVVVAVIAAIVLAMWYVFRLAVVGAEAFPVHLKAVANSSAVTVIMLDTSRTLVGAISYLVRGGAALIMIASWLWVWRLCVLRDTNAPRHVLFACMSLVWCVWYLMFSVGWDRYAFDAFALACLSAGGAILSLVHFARNAIRSADPVSRLAALGALGVVSAVAVAFGIQLTRRGVELMSSPAASIYTFARYVNNAIDESAVIETWEWQLAPLVSHSLHFPENYWVDQYTSLIFGGRPLERQYDIRAAEPHYLVEGPFSSWTGIYRDALNDGCCTLVHQVGEYALYSVRATWRPGAVSQVPDQSGLSFARAATNSVFVPCQHPALAKKC